MTFSADDTPAVCFPDDHEEPDLSLVNDCHAGKTVLITGAGGWIGSALAKTVSESAPRFLILLDHAEHDLSETYHDLLAAESSRRTPLMPILGDICDNHHLNEIFSTYRPQIVYHLAASKHVPLGECNPFAVVRNNAIGTYRLAMAAKRHGTARLTMVSTDKAANPRSLMGVSKRVAELSLLALTTSKTQMNAVRFGNVYGSRGSVVPLFMRQIACGGPVTITHPDACRYFITLRQAIRLVLAACGRSQDGILIPELGEPTRILDLAMDLISRAGHVPGKDMAIKITGLRPGDKLSESLISTREAAGARAGHALRYVKSPVIGEEELHVAMEWLEHCSRRFDLTGLLGGLCAMVPDYEPSESLLASPDLLRCETEVI